MMHWWCADGALMMHGWCTDEALLMYWWCTDDALMMRWWCADYTRMMCWWCPDDVLMRPWWYHDDAPMMHWWCTYDALIVHWWCTEYDMMHVGQVFDLFGRFYWGRINGDKTWRRRRQPTTGWIWAICLWKMDWQSFAIAKSMAGNKHLDIIIIADIIIIMIKLSS